MAFPGGERAALNNIGVSETMLHSSEWPCTFRSEVNRKEKEKIFEAYHSV